MSRPRIPAATRASATVCADSDGTVSTPSWAPDGKSLLFVSTRGKRYNVYSIPVEGGDAKQLTHAPGSHRFGCYSLDGRQIAFYSNRVRPGELYGFNIYYEVKFKPIAEGVPRLARMVADGTLRASIGVEAPWTQIAPVGQSLLDRRFAGKAVLHVGDE